jgi:hypothetical protein
VILLSARARAALRRDEVLVFDWIPIPLCGATMGEPSLRLASLRTVDRSVHHRLPVRGHPTRAVVVAHGLAYPHLAARDISIDCRRVIGVRHFASDLAPDFAMSTAFGREARLLRPWNVQLIPGN